jgi:hypothetical protein
MNITEDADSPLMYIKKQHFIMWPFCRAFIRGLQNPRIYYTTSALDFNPYFAGFLALTFIDFNPTLTYKYFCVSLAILIPGIGHLVLFGGTSTIFIRFLLFHVLHH